MNLGTLGTGSRYDPRSEGVPPTRRLRWHLADDAVAGDGEAERPPPEPGFLLKGSVQVTIIGMCRKSYGSLGMVISFSSSYHTRDM